jgi:hypothetical protein
MQGFHPCTPPRAVTALGTLNQSDFVALRIRLLNKVFERNVQYAAVYV